MYDNYGLTSQPEVGLLAGATTAVIVLAILLGLILIAVGVFMIITNCKLFKKAGEPWWKAIVPLYNSWVETKIVGLAWWWFPIFAVLTALIARTNDYNFVVYIALLLTSFNYNFNLAKKFGKSNGFAVLTTLLPIIGLPMLAFGSATYNKDAEVDKNGIFSIKDM